MRPQNLSHALIFTLFFTVNGNQIIRGDRGAFLETTTLHKRAQQLLRRVFRFLNIWLIERIYSETPARTGSRKLPRKKLRPEIVKILDLSIDDRMSCTSERFELCPGFIGKRA
jgi:hypothetical protein